MSQPSGKNRAFLRLQAIRTAQSQVEKRMRVVEAQLQKAGTLPPTQPWISFRLVKDVKDLASPFSSLKKALQHDLRQLKAQLKDLKLEERVLRREVVRLRAVGASHTFKQRLKATLEKAQKSGELSEDELRLLRQESEKVLEKFVAILETGRNAKNAAALHNEMVVPIVLTGNEEGGIHARAWKFLGKATESIYQQKAEEGFRHISFDRFSNFQ